MADVRLRRAISRFIADLQELYPGQIERVVLYGSVARGDDRPDSDIDLLMVVKDRRQMDGRLSRLVGEWMALHGRVLSLLLVEPAEYEAVERRGTAFIHAVRDEGEVLVG